MSHNKEEKASAYGFGGVGVLLLAGGVCTLCILFTSSIGGTVSLITGLLSVGMGVFLCGYAYRLLTPGSRPTVVKEQPSSPQSSELSTPIAPSEPRQHVLYCPKCSSPYVESDAFCKTCGLTLSTPATQTEPAIETMTCSHCSATIPTKANFCPKCGSAVSHVATTEPKVFVETPAIQKQTRRQQQP